MTDVNVLEREAQLAWREYCGLVHLWVAQGRISAEVSAFACEDKGKEVWIRAYLRIRRRTAGLGDLDEFDRPQ